MFLLGTELMVLTKKKTEKINMFYFLILLQIKVVAGLILLDLNIHADSSTKVDFN